MLDGLCLATLQTENDSCLILTVSNPNLLSFTNKGCFKPLTNIFEYLTRGFAAWQIKSTNSKAIKNKKMLGLLSNEDDICWVLKRLGDILDCWWISYVCFVNKTLFTDSVRKILLSLVIQHAVSLPNGSPSIFSPGFLLNVHLKQQ